jgi:acyl carrier protein
MTARPDIITPQAIEDLMIAHVADALTIDPDEVDVDRPLNDFGLDSSDLLSLGQELEDWLGFKVEATLLWYYPTIDKLSRHLGERGAAGA